MDLRFLGFVFRVGIAGEMKKIKMWGFVRASSFYFILTAFIGRVIKNAARDSCIDGG